MFPSSFTERRADADGHGLVSPGKKNNKREFQVKAGAHCATFSGVVLALVLFCSPRVGFAEPYRLHAGDTLQISVWKEETLQSAVVVLPDGSITFPLIGSLPVAGLSAEEVRERIKARLQAYIPDPVVTVLITATEGNLIYVVGKVEKPGPVVLHAPTTVIQALALAGGVNRFADAERILILRGQGEEAEFLRFDHKQLMIGEGLDANIELRAGDVILVP